MDSATALPLAHSTTLQNHYKADATIFSIPTPTQKELDTSMLHPLHQTHGYNDTAHLTSTNSIGH